MVSSKQKIRFYHACYMLCLPHCRYFYQHKDIMQMAETVVFLIKELFNSSVLSPFLVLVSKQCHTVVN